MARPDATSTRLFELAEAQAGYFTAAQARDAGYSYAAQNHHHKAGNWRREGWGIYRLRDFPYTPGEELVRLMLWSRNRQGETQAAVSHESALEAYSLSDVLPADIHLTAPKGFRKRPPRGVVLHRAHLASNEVRERDGYRVTTPLRTLLDVAASDLSPEHLQVAIHEAIQQGLVRTSELDRALAEAPVDARRRLAAARLP